MQRLWFRFPSLPPNRPPPQRKIPFRCGLLVLGQRSRWLGRHAFCVCQFMRLNQAWRTRSTCNSHKVKTYGGVQEADGLAMTAAGGEEGNERALETSPLPGEFVPCNTFIQLRNNPTQTWFSPSHVMVGDYLPPPCCTHTHTHSRLPPAPGWVQKDYVQLPTWNLRVPPPSTENSRSCTFVLRNGKERQPIRRRSARRAHPIGTHSRRSGGEGAYPNTNRERVSSGGLRGREGPPRN